MAGKNPIKFTDTTFRDGHQSLLATRMRSEDIIPFMERMDQMGYLAIEVWGGATFDTTHRFLGDDPWERIRTIKGILKKTPTSDAAAGPEPGGLPELRRRSDLPLRALHRRGRGGHLPGLRRLERHAQLGSLGQGPDGRQKGGLMAHFQGAMCYTLTQRRLGGPIFNLEYYVDFAKKIEEMGADSVCPEGHGRHVLPQRRLRHHQGHQGDRQDPGGVPHPLHLRLRAP